MCAAAGPGPHTETVSYTDNTDNKNNRKENNESHEHNCPATPLTGHTNIQRTSTNNSTLLLTKLILASIAFVAMIFCNFDLNLT
jgi:hypothetical protein